MRILYLDCATGISGNMTVGALIEACNGEEYLRRELAKVNLPDYEIKITKKASCGINGTYFEVVEKGTDIPVDSVHGHGDLRADRHHDNISHSDKHHMHTHHHFHHEHRKYKDIKALIRNSSITEGAKHMALDMFYEVAAAEAKVHNKPVNEVAFHEVGAIDSIIDIVGTAILVDYIKPDKIISSTVNDGFGTVRCAHGELSVPVPATAEIYKNKGVIFKQICIETELVTPTGAAIIGTLSSQYELMPPMKLLSSGAGVGSRKIGRANILRTFIGELNDDASDEDIIVINSNIDDSTGEELALALEKLMAAGAIDVSFAPIIMKKNRPAYRLEVICKAKDKEDLSEIIFDETTTIGLRYYEVKREELERESIIIDTELGRIKGKRVITKSGKLYVYPEFDDIKRISSELGIPAKSLKISFERGINK